MSVKKWLTLKYPGLSLLVIGFFALCLTLSNWQYQRSKTKALQIQQLQTRILQTPLTGTALQDQERDLRFFRITLTGHFDTGKAFLLDNKIESGKVGYELYIPFYLSDSAMPILVDRGFIPQGTTRKILPTIAEEPQEQEITGMLNGPPPYFALGQMVGEAQPDWPLRIQYVGLAEMEKWLGVKLYRFVLMQNVNTASQQMIEKFMPISPERHKGYAFQWFALAVTLLILFFVLNRTS